MSIVLDQFAYRHWDDPSYTGARVTNMTKDEFMHRVREHIASQGGFDKCSEPGYAPFCRHVFIRNITDACADVVEITDAIAPLIKSGYRSRRPTELPVLCRWIERKDVPGGVKRADYLDLIFYSRAQLEKEAAAMNEEITPGEWEWGLISLKAQLVGHETPMQPITAMRNALGVEFGGSSNPINFNEYQKSVDFWEKYISIQ